MGRYGIEKMQSSHTAPPLHKGENQMDYVKKLQTMDEHLARHPHDYQTVIARLKLASEVYDHQVWKTRQERLKRLSEIKKRLKEEDDERVRKSNS